LIGPIPNFRLWRRAVFPSASPIMKKPDLPSGIQADLRRDGHDTRKMLHEFRPRSPAAVGIRAELGCRSMAISLGRTWARYARGVGSTVQPHKAP
jgi:hypothetical protein